MDDLSSDLGSLEDLKNTMKSTTGQRIWAIGGGKGGVGKSLFAANTSICLALMGYKVVSIDLDLGGANLHTCLGVPIPSMTLSDYVTKKTSNIEDLISPTPIKNLSIISGAQDEVGVANLKYLQKAKLMSKLSKIDADYIIFDLGAGTTFNTLDFFIMAHKGILVVLPEPTSIENTYRFIKSMFHRKLSQAEELLDIRPLINRAANSKIGESQSPASLIESAIELDPDLGHKLKREIKKLNPKLVINQVRTQADIDIGFSMKSICKRYFGVDMDFVGYLDYDSAVWQSVKRRKPLLMEFPNSPLVNNFDRIVTRLIEEDHE